MKIEFDFDIGYFCQAMLIAMAATFGTGLLLEWAHISATDNANSHDQAYLYFSKGVALTSIVYCIWTVRCSVYFFAKMFHITRKQ